MINIHVYLYVYEKKMRNKKYNKTYIAIQRKKASTKDLITGKNPIVLSKKRTI